MEEKQLSELKKRISNLTPEEKKQRDLYLKRLSNGEIQGPPVGYSSIDKPWLRNYSDKSINTEIPQMSCYRFLYENNKEHLDDEVIDYFGTKITYRKLFREIDKAAEAYRTMGVKKGDIVTICSITTPEIMYSFYALNKIGAISNMVDLRYPSKAIEEFICESKSKYCVVLEPFKNKISEILNTTPLEKIITISPVNSAPLPVKTIYKLKTAKNVKKGSKDSEKKFISWNSFISSRKKYKIDEVPFETDYPVVIPHTGGTTGIPKGTYLTNEALNSVTIQIRDANVKTGRGFKFLNIMPPFIAYGIGLGLNAPIILGWKTTILPNFDAKDFPKILIKYKPEGIMGVPSYWETVMESKDKKLEDLSFLKIILLGGTKVQPEFEKRLVDYLKKHNCNNGEVDKGYSLTEAAALATLSSKNINKLDSAGIPLSKTNIAAFEPGTTKELQTGEMGEICITSPNIMKEYLNNPEETAKVKVKHEDGYWIHTGDIGYVDEDGFVFPKDRIKRMIPRSGFKVFPSQLENLFMTHYAVKTCAVVSMPDKIDTDVPWAVIVLKDEYKGMEDVVKEQLIELFNKSSLPPYFLPAEFKFYDELPYTNIGKVDFVEVQKSLKNSSR